MTTAGKHVLIVEDDDDIAAAVSRGLRREGYEVYVTSDVASARARLDQHYDAAIIDSMLGQDRGEDLIREMRAQGIKMPIIMLSALSGVDDRTRGLASGADDYVAKPFEFSELVARLRVQENRRAVSAPSELVVERDRRQLIRGAHSVTLTQRELDLLDFMLDHAGQVLSRGEIFDALWLNEGGSAENVVDVYIGYLRRKFGSPDKFGVEIKTVRGKGFLLTRQTETNGVGT